MRYGLIASTDRAASVARLVDVERFAVDGASVADMVDGCALLDLVEDGTVTGTVAVEVRGDVATIKAATAEGDKTWQALALLEVSLRMQGVRTIGFFSRRLGMVREASRAGYELVSAEYRKAL